MTLSTEAVLGIATLLERIASSNQLEKFANSESEYLEDFFSATSFIAGAVSVAVEDVSTDSSTCSPLFSLFFSFSPLPSVSCLLEGDLRTLPSSLESLLPPVISPRAKKKAVIL